MVTLRKVFKSKQHSFCYAVLLVAILTLYFMLTTTEVEFSRYQSYSKYSRPFPHQPPLAESPRCDVSNYTSSNGSGHVCGVKVTSDEIPVPFEFNANGNDVFVFMHIPKTSGGNVMRKLVKLKIDPRCKFYDPDIKTEVDKFKCSCLNNNNVTWLFGDCNGNRWDCGEHADMSTLETCVPSYLDAKEGPRMRKYFYVTIIRDPVMRYLSEWRHTARGGLWTNAYLMCNGPFNKVKKIKQCYKGDNWKNVSLKEFMECSHNYAPNRETWMLADLNSIGCERLRNMTTKDQNALVLESAKTTLRNMAFFGVSEHFEETQFLFERTFGVKFIKQGHTWPNAAGQSLGQLTGDDLQSIERLNHMDLELYKYAYSIFLDRLNNIENITD